MKSNSETQDVAVNDVAAKTLRELGFDPGFAAELESAFRLMGAVDGDRVVGFTLSTPDGQRHELRVEKREAQPDVGRAA